MKLDNYQNATLGNRSMLGYFIGGIATIWLSVKGVVKKGESKQVTFTITPELLKFYNYDLQYVDVYKRQL